MNFTDVYLYHNLTFYMEKTFKIMLGTITKYETLVVSLSPPMDDKDAALLKAYSNVLKDLKQIQKHFLAGE